MKDIVIVGAGATGREIAWLISEINKEKKQWNIIGFIDDDADIQGEAVDGIPVIGTTEWIYGKRIAVVCAIGNVKIKYKLFSELKNYDLEFPSLVHPNVIRAWNTFIGKGCVIYPWNILFNDSYIEDFVHISSLCTIEHDARIGEYSRLSPGINISGNVTIGKAAEIGTKSCFIQQVKVGCNVILGAGSTVISDIPDNCTAVGSPAKPIKFTDRDDPST